ncbi:hypothetical protein M3Y94_00242000 [Aphelenchoides besseyi]|nr:hypothetical protein M3Y94_00242000 [Aphelenchoides besseyi]KAI6236341.1 hypothetical protein M3Y95_00147100 [Aphelenchoides besseyi]
MENGSGTTSTSSYASPGPSTSTSAPSTTVNGLRHPHKSNGDSYRKKFLHRERQELLAERQRILDRTDPSLRRESTLIIERRDERKQMIRESKKRKELWYKRRREDELQRIEHEKQEEIKGLQMLLYNQLEKLKECLQDRVKQMNLLDRRTLSVLDAADKPLDLEPQLTEDDDALTESPTAAVILEKRDTLPGRLTSDSAIKSDLLYLNQSTTPTDVDYYEVARLIRPRHKVALDKSRLVYDGKTFYRGQKLFVQTTNYTRFPAIVAMLADEYVHIKARQPGDTREVFATLDDLRSGRVRIGRKVEHTDTPPKTGTSAGYSPRHQTRSPLNSSAS